MKATRMMKLQLNKDTLLSLSNRELAFAAAAADVDPGAIARSAGICFSVTTPIVNCCPG